MKSIVLSSVAIALIVFTGCSDKEPAVDEKPAVEKQVVKKPQEEKVVEKVENVKTEVVAEDDALVNSDSTLQEENMESESNSNSTATDSMSIDDIKNKLSTIYFSFDQFNISSDMQNKISEGATVIDKAETNFNIKLEGNCDEWGSDEYNFALGLKRANSVKKALIAEGVDSNRISMVSYGESNPVCEDKTQECWSQNRRVDFTLLP